MIPLTNQADFAFDLSNNPNTFFSTYPNRLCVLTLKKYVRRYTAQI